MVERPSADGDRHTVRPPTFGALLRQLRDDRRISREKLATVTGMSASYVTHLEKGERDHPTRSVVEALARSLDGVHALSRAERRHLFDLAGLVDTVIPTVAQLRADITPAMRHGLELHGLNPAGYVDSRCNLLACNAVASAILHGLPEGANLLHWIFGDPVAADVLVDWEEAARLSVATLRARMGRTPPGEWSAALLDELGRYPDFRRMWGDGVVDFADASAVLRLRERANGRPIVVDFQMYEVDTGGYPGWVRFFVGLRRAV
ncbi:helix-turn-helix transcriptional regulator [Nocardia xishanensis]